MSGPLSSAVARQVRPGVGEGEGVARECRSRR